MTNKVLLTAALAGIAAATAMIAAPVMAADTKAPAAAEKNSCKGNDKAHDANSCKGQDKNSCKGNDKNSCKGK